ncbi:MAG: hypothetical protein EOP64_00160 [Sphingomonas sp.]|nr:MAG: hypothetical protein EOP64_00160 [Sphingomonas sp.]
MVSFLFNCYRIFHLRGSRRRVRELAKLASKSGDLEALQLCRLVEANIGRLIANRLTSSADHDALERLATVSRQAACGSEGIPYIGRKVRM